MTLFNFQGTGKWYELQDLHVTDILPQMITLTEAYIQVTIQFLSSLFLFIYINKTLKNYSEIVIEGLFEERAHAFDIDEIW